MTDPADLVEARLNANHAEERARALATIQSMRRRSWPLLMLIMLSFPAVDLGLRGFHTDPWWAKSLISGCCSLAIMTFMLCWQMHRQLLAVTTLLLQLQLQLQLQERGGAANRHDIPATD